MKEVIVLQVGRAGVHIGDACWNQLRQEHGIGNDGRLNSDDSDVSEAFFDESVSGKWVPRSIFIDLDCEEINGLIRQSSLYDIDYIISGKEDAADNYARGYFTVGREILPTIEDRIRRMAEQCSSLEGFISIHSLGGGTGSGLGSSIADRLDHDYKKKIKAGVMIMPSQQLSNSILDNYNTVLAIDSIRDLRDFSVCLDNESLYNACQYKLRIERPCFKDINAIIGQVFSSITSSMRFHGSSIISLSDIATNMVPYPLCHNLLIGFIHNCSFINIQL